MQAIELRFVRQQIIKAVINPAGTIALPYGEQVYRAPAGVFCYVEAATFAAFNVAATRQCYLGDASASAQDALTEAVGVGFPPSLPASSGIFNSSIRGAFVASGVLYLASSGIVTGEQVGCRIQLGLYVPDAHIVEPDSIAQVEEPEEVYVNA